MPSVQNFTVIESIYGRFVVNRHCDYQAEALIKTGRTHIEAELANIFVLVDRLPDGAVIVDGGSNIGFFAIPVAQRVKGRGIRISCFEPQRLIFYALAAGIVLNDLEHCYANNLALGEEDGYVHMPAVNYGARSDFGTVSVQTQGADDDSVAMSHHRVRAVRLDSLALPRLDFLKLDVEGFEPQALRGARATIERFRPWIWVEFFISSEAKIREALAGIADYSFHFMDPQNMLCAPAERVAAGGLVFRTGEPPPSGAAA